MKINIKKLAELAGVDVSTVSRALNDSDRVKPETKRRIKALAEQYQYVRNDVARSLVSQKNDSIGVLVPEFVNTFYAEIIEGLEGVFRGAGYTMIFGKSGFDPEEEAKIIDMFVRRSVDGIVLCSPNRITVDSWRKLKRDIPLVLLDAFEPYPDVDAVGIDNEQGVQAIVDHLVMLGHKEFAFIGDSKITPSRLSAYRAGLARHGLALDSRCIFVGEERYEEGGYIRMKELLTLAGRPTAVFTGTDKLAIGALRAAKEAGVDVPGDLSLVGFDDIMAAAYAEVPLTTVFQPKEEIGREAANLLLDRINHSGGDRRNLVLPTRLIVRNTTGFNSLDR